MKRAKSICRQVGCNMLVEAPGYCDMHRDKIKDRFKRLDKAPGSRAFYGGYKWTKTSRAFRAANPICAEHKRQGYIVKGAIADHTTEVPELIAQGLDPYNWAYLQNLCIPCHNRKLNDRRKKNNRRDKKELRRLYG